MSGWPVQKNRCMADTTLALAAQALASLRSQVPDADRITLTASFSPGHMTYQVKAYDSAGAHDLADTSPLKAIHHLGGWDATPGTIEVTVHQDGSWQGHLSEVDPTELLIRPLEYPQRPVALPPLTEAQQEELSALWEQGKSDYEAGPPATEEDLAELAEQLGVPVPPQLTALLQIANGAEVSVDNPFDEDEEGDTPDEDSDDEDLDEEDGDEDADEEDDEDEEYLDEEDAYLEQAYQQTLTSGWQLLPTARIASEWKHWCELAADGSYDGVACDIGRVGVAQPRLVHPGWVPFASDGAGNYLAIDTVPGPRGVAGQVVEFGTDLVDGPYVHADSLVDFLAKRRYEWPDDPGLDHLVQADEPRPLTADDVPAEVQSLRVFNLSEASGSVVARATNLKMLLLRRVGQVDLSGLQELPLQELRLLDLPRVDLTPLAGHPTLRRISLESIEHLDGAATLAQLPALETVETEKTPTDGLRSLAGHPRLHRVKLGDSRPMTEAVRIAQQLVGDQLTLHEESGQL